MICRYPPHLQPLRTNPGDILLVRSGTTAKTTVLGQVIQAGERVRYGDTDFARWTHSALIGFGDKIYEADESGVVCSTLKKYLEHDYAIVSPTASYEQRMLALGFVHKQVGAEYGIVNFLTFIMQCLFGFNLSVHMDRQFICSGLVSRATEKYITAYPRSPECMMPADLAAYWGAASGRKLPEVGLVGKLLNALVLVVDTLTGRHGDAP